MFARKNTPKSLSRKNYSQTQKTSVGQFGSLPVSYSSKQLTKTSKFSPQQLTKPDKFSSQQQLTKPDRFRSKSPYRLTKSDRFRSKSPYRLKKPDRIRSKSPYKSDRFRSKSPSPYRLTKPGKFRSKSPYRLRKPDRIRSKSPSLYRLRKPDRIRSKSPYRLRKPDRIRSKSPSPYRLTKKSTFYKLPQQEIKKQIIQAQQILTDKKQQLQQLVHLPVKTMPERLPHKTIVDNRDWWVPHTQDQCKQALESFGITNKESADAWLRTTKNSELVKSYVRNCAKRLGKETQLTDHDSLLPYIAEMTKIIPANDQTSKLLKQLNLLLNVEYYLRNQGTESAFILHRIAKLGLANIADKYNLGNIDAMIDPHNTRKELQLASFSETNLRDLRYLTNYNLNKQNQDLISFLLLPSRTDGKFLPVTDRFNWAVRHQINLIYQKIEN